VAKVGTSNQDCTISLKAAVCSCINNKVTLLTSLYGTGLLKTAVVKSPVYEVTFIWGGV
jgi:hypothetical protein